MAYMNVYLSPEELSFVKGQDRGYVRSLIKERMTRGGEVPDGYHTPGPSTPAPATRTKTISPEEYRRQKEAK